jgi:hypothetical protein
VNKFEEGGREGGRERERESRSLLYNIALNYT